MQIENCHNKKFIIIAVPWREELKATNLIREIDFDAVKELCSIMEHLLLTVIALDRKDANLITAKGAVNFLLKKLYELAFRT